MLQIGMRAGENQPATELCEDSFYVFTTMLQCYQCSSLPMLRSRGFSDKMTVVVIFFGFDTLTSEVMCSFQNVGMKICCVVRNTFFEHFFQASSLSGEAEHFHLKGQSR